MPAPDARTTDVAGLADGVLSGQRASVARAITLVESTRPADRAAARHLLSLLSGVVRDESALLEASSGPKRRGLPRWGVRVGISGPPGTGKSTFIEELGTRLTAAGHRVGVLAVDPSSVRTGGSVLGDKTRMPRLAADPAAYVRPSPSAGTLGGVTRATTQAITVLEAAAYDVVLVETVGVGQSETAVAGMVDTYLLLTLARTGDQLQGLKKGTLELADVVAVNKADGDRVTEARSAARELAGALRLVEGRRTPVVACSALTGEGVDEVWAAVLAHREALGDAGLEAKRAEQRVETVWELVRDELESRLRTSPAAERVRERLRAGELDAAQAADAIMAVYDGGPRGPREGPG